MKLDPQAAYPHSGLGNIYWDLGRYEDAVAEYRDAIELDPRFAGAYRKLGHVLRRLNRTQEAASAYRKAIELDPTIVWAHTSLAACYRKMGRMSEYEEELREAHARLAEDDAYNWACLEAVVGNSTEALTWLKEAIKKEPGRRAWARRDPNLDGIRDDPRFKELVGE